MGFISGFFNDFTNIIFANEAIMSQGELNHVVGALQAKTDEEIASAASLASSRAAKTSTRSARTPHQGCESA